MSNKIDFSAFASECLRLARNAATVEDQAILLEMGQVWVKLAERADAVQALIEQESDYP